MERLNKLSKNLEELSILKDKDGKPIFSEEQLTALRAYIAELKKLEENSGKTEDGITTNATSNSEYVICIYL